MARFRSKQQLLLQDTWRRAYRSKDGIQVTFETEAQAHRLRMVFYNAVKLEKQGKGDDQELIRAVEEVEIVFGPAGKHQLWLRPKNLNPAIAAIEEALGVKMQDMQDPEIMESFNRAMEKAGVPTNDAGLAIEHQENPFYPKRRG